MESTNSYRDSIVTVDKKGKRVWIFPKKPVGKFYNRRKLVSYLLLVFLLSGPFLRINGRPLLMLNILERKFVILGKVFWPQDLHIFAIAMITMVVFVVLFTIIFGRLFCGWVCPQTIFMEMVFRRLEYWIDGDWKDQQRLSKLPWNREKVLKRTLKLGIFWIISFVIANTFLAYIIGSEQLIHIIADDPANHIGGLLAIIIFTTVFYLVYSKFREQVCTVVCPYGRLQDVLLDRRSLLVAYDFVRGEKRGLFKKNEDRPAAQKGDCIDCHQCINVCPTGIDIRNGAQLECVNCTACIDACDHMMEGVGLPKGLIRYASIDGIEKKSGFQFTARVKAYSVVLVILLGLMIGLLVTRSDFEATILRTRGTLFQEVEEGVFVNIYDISIVNKTDKDFPLELRLLKGKGQIKMVGDKLTLKAQQETTDKFMIFMNEKNFHSRKMDVVIGIYSNNELIETRSTTFITPSL